MICEQIAEYESSAGIREVEERVDKISKEIKDGEA